LEESKRLTLSVKDLETINDNTKMIHILNLQKQHLQRQLSIQKSEIIRLEKSANYLNLIEDNKAQITQK